MSCDHELANEWVRCSGRNANYITIFVVVVVAGVYLVEDVCLIWGPPNTGFTAFEIRVCFEQETSQTILTEKISKISIVRQRIKMAGFVRQRRSRYVQFVACFRAATLINSIKINVHCLFAVTVLVNRLMQFASFSICYFFGDFSYIFHRSAFYRACVLFTMFTRV